MLDNQVDPKQVNGAGENGSRPGTGLRRAGPAPKIAVALAVVAVAVLGVRGFLARDGAPAPSLAAAPAPPPARAEPDVEVTMEPSRVREALAPVSSDPLFRRWLAFDDALRRAAVVVDNLDEGVSPRAPLSFLAPRRGFTVARRGADTVIAPTAYGRYDGFAAAVDSVDARALATAYAAVRPALGTAYRALGYPGASVDAAVARALRRLADAPVVDGEVAVVARGGVFVLVDRDLEALGAVEKHLLRMGPRNTRTIQAKARELLSTLELGAPGPRSAAR